MFLFGTVGGPNDTWGMETSFWRQMVDPNLDMTRSETIPIRYVHGRGLKEL